MHGPGAEPMHGQAVYVDRAACGQERLEVVPVATAAHLCVVEVLAAYVITAEHPIRCLSSDVQPLVGAKATQVGPNGNGHVSPLLAERALRCMPAVLDDGHVEEPPRRVVVGSTRYDANQREVTLEMLGELGKGIVV